MSSHHLFRSFAGLVALSVCLVLQMTSVLASDLETLKGQYQRPDYIPFPENAGYSPQIVTLGKMLFFDPRLSGAKNMTCATCHNPSFGYEAPVSTSVGAAGTALERHSPTILNAAWIAPLFWDGRADTLEEQAAGPITAAVEMDGKFEVIIEELAAVSDYSKWFDHLFPDTGISRDTILTAIAAYERTVVSGWAPFDRWLDGDKDALTASARRGFELFNGKAACADCHSGWNFTDNAFHDIGLATKDVGRADIDASDAANKHAFKTPGLRNIVYRAPYMHNGSLPDLNAVLAHYVGGGIERPSLSKKMRPVDLSEEDIEDLVAFLKSLTAERSESTLPILPN